MLSLFKSNQSLSVCMPNNLGCWQDQITLGMLCEEYQVSVVMTRKHAFDLMAQGFKYFW